MLAAALAAAAREVRAPEPPRAAGGAVLAAAERSPHTLIGRVLLPGHVDAQGWAATFAVERALAGGLEPGARLRIAWEELAPSRRARLVDGGYALVVLEALPNGSLWSARFPRRDVLAIAAGGDAFLRDPDGATVAALARHLALAPAQREQAAGVAALAELAQRGEPGVALQAHARLGEIPALAQRLEEPARASLAALLADPARGEALRAAALDVAGRRKLTALLPSLRSLAEAGGALEPAALEALGAMDALSGDELKRLVAGRDPAARAAAIRAAPGVLEPGRLAALAKGDPAGAVRAAALDALVRREGARAADVAVDALFDSDGGVQAASLRALPAFPAESARRLRARLFGARTGETDRLRPALAALGMIGDDGRAVLLEVESSHPDEQLRGLARFLLGHEPPH